MKLENTVLSKVTQAQKTKYHMLSLKRGLQSSDFNVFGCWYSSRNKKGDREKGKEEPYREDVGSNKTCNVKVMG